MIVCMFSFLFASFVCIPIGLVRFFAWLRSICSFNVRNSQVAFEFHFAKLSNSSADMFCMHRFWRQGRR